VTAAAASEPPEVDTAYHLHTSELISRLSTDAQRGLSEEDARARLAQFGPNELAAEQPVPGWRRFLSQFQDVLVILLLVATGISAALWLSSATRRCRTKPSPSLSSCFSTRRWATCRNRVPRPRSRRCGRCRRPKPWSIRGRTAKRPGLADRSRRHHPHRGGDTIPADARLIESAALQTAEAALTGRESARHQADGAIEATCRSAIETT
jgi:Ca2+-transporting ATPase